jgi:hypothetical protein
MHAKARKVYVVMLDLIEPGNCAGRVLVERAMLVMASDYYDHSAAVTMFIVMM